MVVGITGGIGSGKSLVAKAFCSFQNTVHVYKHMQVISSDSPPPPPPPPPKSGGGRACAARAA